MRIAFFTDTFLPEVNGVTHTLDQLREYLIKSEHDFLFFAPDYGQATTLSSEYIYRFKSIPFPFYGECRLSFPIYSKIKKQLNDFKPDLIHVVTPVSIGHVGARYAREYDIPMVASFHTNFDAYLKYYNLQGFEKYIWHFFRKFHSQFIINFCPSQNTFNRLLENQINNLKIWTRGIDTISFSPTYRDKKLFDLLREHPKDDIVTLLYVGRLALEKNLNILFESIQLLNRHYANRIELIVVGDGPERKHLESYGLKNVYFTGYLQGAALSAVYASADVFVFPSTTETLGNVVLEAMASGLPVIAVNAGGVVDNVFHAHNGFLAKPVNSFSFSEAIRQLIENPKQISIMGKNALAHVANKSWQGIFEQLILDYKQAIIQFRKLIEKNYKKTA